MSRKKKSTMSRKASGLDLDALDLPKHKRFQLALEEQIRKGVYSPGDRLPTEKELMAQHGLSYATVSRAMRELARNGLVERIRKRGTFVCDNPQNFTTPLAQTPAAHSLALFHGGIPQGFHPYFTGLVDGMIAAAGAHDLSMKFVATKHGDIGITDDFLERHGICGFAVTMSVKEQIESALKKKIPLVMLSQSWRDLTLDRVVVDTRQGFRDIFKHFHEAGHKRVAILDVRRRLDVYELAAEAYGCLPDAAPVDEIYVGNWDEEAAADGLKQLQKLRSKPTAVCIGDDFLLMHFLRLAREAEIKIPQQLAVVGRGSTLSIQMLGSRISMVEADPYAIATAAVELLVEQVREKRAPGKIKKITPKLVVRQSG